MKNDLNIAINVLETVSGSMENLKMESTKENASAEYIYGVSNCIDIIKTAIMTLRAVVDSQQQNVVRG